MARAGLGPSWRCVFANDFDHKKSGVYASNWGSDGLVTGDVRAITAAQMPGVADLVWASFPCQDLSLAGGGAGLRGDRSGTFWPFWQLVKDLCAEGRAPKLIVLENVCGTLTSHGGKDFAAIAEAFVSEGYKFGAIVVDASLFVPQSRRRLFVIGIAPGTTPVATVTVGGPTRDWHPAALRKAHAALSEAARASWLWWSLPKPKERNVRLVDVVERNPQGVAWHSSEETRQLISMMSKVNRAKLVKAQRAKGLSVGTIYKRTRRDDDGAKVQRAEVRFDDIAGCLRTPAGGSSRQLIMVVDDGQVRSRLMSPRETARLMGLDDSYKLPRNTNEAFHLTGDGVVVDVVRHIAEHILEPIVLRPQRVAYRASPARKGRRAAA